MNKKYEKYQIIMKGEGYALLVGNLSDLMDEKDKNEKIKKMKEKVKTMEYMVHPKVIVFGKECNQNRSVKFLSNVVTKYKYAGYDAMASPIPEEFDPIMKLFDDEKMNGILANRYENGDEYIGVHSDDESELTKIGVISITFCEKDGERRFQIRPKKDMEVEINGVKTFCKQGHICCEVVTTDEMVIIMQGSEFQRLFTHKIPVQTNPVRLGRKKNKNNEKVGTRWSLTLRKHNINVGEK